MNLDYEILLKSLEERQLKSRLSSLRFINRVAIFIDETASLRRREIELYENLDESGYNLRFKTPFFDKLKALLKLGEEIHDYIKSNPGLFSFVDGMLICDIPANLKQEVDDLLKHHMSVSKSAYVGYGELRAIMQYSPCNEAIVTKDGQFVADLSRGKSRFYSEVIVNDEGLFEESRFDLDLRSNKFGHRQVSTDDLGDVVFCKWTNISDAFGNSISKEGYLKLTRFLQHIADTHDIESLYAKYALYRKPSSKLRLNLEDYGIKSFSEERHNKGRDSTTTRTYVVSPAGLTIGFGLFSGGLEMMLNGRAFLSGLRSNPFNT